MAKMYPIVAPANSVMHSGMGTNYVVKTASGAYYVVYVDISIAGANLYFRKSTDGGKTWSNATSLAAINCSQVAVWYDRWSGISGDLIHIAYSDVTSDDTFYRSINAASADALSSQTTIFAGSSTANGGAISITRARGGNLYCKVMIDAGVEGGFFRSVDVGANWTSRTDAEALATTDQWILLPGWAADNQDIMCFFWDASADEISRYLYDDSGNSWGETSIATTMVENTSITQFGAAVDITNSQNLLVAWTAVDTANADLRLFAVTESAITEKTEPVLNSTDDQANACISINTDNEDWYVFYTGKSDGSETFASNLNVYYKTSTDDGATWGAETKLTPDTGGMPINALWATPRFNTRHAAMWITSNVLLAAIDETPSVQPTYALGI